MQLYLKKKILKSQIAGVDSQVFSISMRNFCKAVPPKLCLATQDSAHWDDIYITQCVVIKHNTFKNSLIIHKAIDLSNCR